MRRFKELVLTAAITCSAVIMQSCNNGTDITAGETVSTELLRTSQSWNEMDLPENVTGEEIRHCNVQKVSAAISAAVNEGMKSETTGGNEADDEVHDEYLDEIESKN